MRIVKEIFDFDIKVTVFNWNGKYLVKFEEGDLEQTFKINETDLCGDEDLDEIINEEFVKEVKKQFLTMHHILSKHTEGI